MSNLDMSKDELDSVLHWRGKHAQVVRERDALQLLLNAADQRNDDLTVPPAGVEVEATIWTTNIGKMVGVEEHVAIVTGLQADFKAKYQDHKRELQKAWDQRDALKAASDFNFKQAQENAEERDKVSAHRAELMAELAQFKDGDLKTQGLREQEAEIEALKAEMQERKEFYEGFSATQSDVISRCNQRRWAAESELTKARELLKLANVHVPVNYPARKTIDAFLAHQSAPAAKGDGDEL